MNVAALDIEQEAERADDTAKSASEPADKVRQLNMAARLAWFLARPSVFANQELARFGKLDADKLQALCQSDAFRGPINRALARNAQNGAGRISAGTVDGLAVSPALRLGVVILTAPLHETSNIGVMLGAAVLSRRIRNLILKSDREAMRETLGIVGFDIAVQEAPLLYPLLAGLDRTPADYALFQPTHAVEERQNLSVELGFQLIGRFLDAIEPEFAKLYERRLPAAIAYADRARLIAEFDDAHCNQFLRLIRRRQKTWSDIIG